MRRHRIAAVAPALSPITSSLASEDVKGVRLAFSSLGKSATQLLRTGWPWVITHPGGVGGRSFTSRPNPVSPTGIRRGANRVLPSSWGTSVFRLPCSNPTPAGLLVSDHCDTAAWPLVCKKQRLPRKVFRSSIAWLSDWLSTLRSADYSNTTQDSLPVAGQALPDGISTRKVPLKGFKVADYISFPFPKLCLAQLHRPRRRSNLANSRRSNSPPRIGAEPNSRWFAHP